MLIRLLIGMYVEISKSLLLLYVMDYMSKIIGPIFGMMVMISLYYQPDTESRLREC